MVPSRATPERLRPPTRALIDGNWRSGRTIFLSAVTASEVALLGDTGRVALSRPVEAWIERCLDRSAIEATPLGHRAARRSYILHCLLNREAAVRLCLLPP